MELDPQFIKKLTAETETGLYLKKDKAVSESKIDKQIVKVLRENNIELSATDEKGEYIFGFYSAAVKEKIHESLREQGFKIIGAEQEKNREKPINAEPRRQQDFFRKK